MIYCVTFPDGKRTYKYFESESDFRKFYGNFVRSISPDISVELVNRMTLKYLSFSELNHTSILDVALILKEAEKCKM